MVTASSGGTGGTFSRGLGSRSKERAQRTTTNSLEALSFRTLENARAPRCAPRLRREPKAQAALSAGAHRSHVGAPRFAAGMIAAGLLIAQAARVHPIAWAPAAFGDAAEPARRARRLFAAVRDGVRYDPYRLDPRRAAFRASAVLASEANWCVPKAILLTAGARAAAWPRSPRTTRPAAAARCPRRRPSPSRGRT